MKKLVLFFFFALLLQAAIAKEVSVSFNFPLNSGFQDFKQTITTVDDANAFTAIMQAASSAALSLGVSYYDFDSDGVKESAFIDSINGVSASEDFSKYWQFSINNTPAMVGVSSFIPENNDAIALDYLDGRIPDAFEWLLDFQKSNGEIGSNVFQHSIALSALSLAASSNIDAESAISNAVSNLLSKQSPDSGFGDELYTSVATMALLSNGKSLDEFDVSGKTSVELLEERQQSDGGFKSGSSTSDVDTSSWALLAFRQAGLEAPLKDGKSPIDYLISAQHSNGSFGYNASDASESVDFTEEALIAFGVSGAESSESAGKAIEWLSGRQDSEGCISDGFRTALGSIAFKTGNELENSGKAAECLKTLQNGDGSFGRSSNPSNAIDTAFAIVALSSAEFPLNVSQDSNGSGNGSLGLNSVVKFSIEIENNGSVRAKNVNVLLSGIPSGWLLSEAQGSISHFGEIEPGEKRTAEIFAVLKSTGSYDVQARVTSDQIAESIGSNILELGVEEAALEVVLRVSG